jgi:hypothetical protein
VARRATGIALERDSDPSLLIVSAGDYYGDKGIIDMYRGKYLSRVMMRMGYSAVGIGEAELAYGPRPMLEDLEAGLPIICSNLYREEKPIFPAFALEEANGWKVGFFSLLLEEPRELGEFELRDPVVEGMNAIEQLEDKGCDLVVLIVHGRRERLEEVLPGLVGVDLVIRGHTMGIEDAAEDCVDTIGGIYEDLGVPVFFAGDRGRVIGKIVLTPAGGGLPSIESGVIYLGDDVKDDSLYAADLKAFFKEEAYRKRDLQMSEFLSRDEKSGAIRERYLGQNVCFTCHSDLMRRFAVDRHFRAFGTLTNRGEEENRRCLPCHATGFGSYSGYDPVEERKSGRDLRGVQCEACHGPGTKHARDGTYRESARTSCAKCHTSQWSPDFDFDAYWGRVSHCGRSEGE